MHHRTEPIHARVRDLLAHARSRSAEPSNIALVALALIAVMQAAALAAVALRLIDQLRL